MPVTRNLIASALGNGWSALVQVVFVPVYIALLGVEAYGLIGVFGFLLALISVADSGLAPVISREVTRALAGARPIEEVRTLLRSLELACAAAAVGIVCLAFSAGPWFSEHWLKADRLDPAVVTAALWLLGAQMAVRLFVVLHRGVISGAQELVWLNAFVAGFATLRAVGVVPLLWVWPSVGVFFAFQALATVLEASVLAGRAWGVLRHRGAATFSWSALAQIRRFSGGMAVMALLWLTLTQSDRLILSAVLPLAEVGHYALAGAVAGALALLVGPFASVAYPRLNELAARGESRALLAAFRQFAQMVAAAVMPAGLVLAFFAEPVLTLWTRDAALSSAAAPLLTVLAIGAVLNASMAIPYVLKLVHGRSRALVFLYSGLLAIFVPSVYLASLAHGAIAAGWAKTALMGVALVMALPLLRSHLSAADAWQWLWGDVAIPAAAATGGAGLVYAFMTPSSSAFTMLAWIMAAYGASLGALLLALPNARAWLSRRRAPSQ